jgi:hypothetical protein
VKIVRHENLIVPTLIQCCKFLDSLSASGTPFFVLLWKGFAPPKIDVFIWLLLNGSLNTRGFLAKRGFVNYEDARFPFYCEEIGTSNHLFHHCTITWNF